MGWVMVSISMLLWARLGWVLLLLETVGINLLYYFDS
jgi:hypothetical protein